MNRPSPPGLAHHASRRNAARPGRLSRTSRANRAVPRPAHIAAGAVVIGGLLVAVVPQQASSIVRLVIVTAAAATALYALVINAPPLWWRSPFDRRANRARHSDELSPVRSALGAPRQRTRGGPPMPPEVLRILRPMVVAALERDGIDPAEPAGRAAARALLSPAALAVLQTEPLTAAGWLRLLPPSPRDVARAADQVLDDLDRLAAGRPNRASRQSPIDHKRPGAT